MPTTPPSESLAGILHHLQTFWERRTDPGIALFHFDDLLADLPVQMKRLAGVLEIDVSDNRIEELAAVATFSQMKERAESLAPNVHNQIWLSSRDFFRRGESGQWRSLLDEADIRRYEQRVAELASPELAAWVHTGWRTEPRPSPDAPEGAHS